MELSLEACLSCSCFSYPFSSLFLVPYGEIIPMVEGTTKQNKICLNICRNFPVMSDLSDLLIQLLPKKGQKSQIYWQENFRLFLKGDH